MNQGRLIVIEGACDGVGKTTQFRLLKENLIKDGEQVITHHFPTYGTKQGALVEEYLKGSYGTIHNLSPYFINSLYAVDRAVTWHTELASEYQQGKIVLLDRYTTSSIIYQSAEIDNRREKEDFIHYVTDFEYHKNGIASPDETIFLWAPYDLITEIRNKRTTNEGISKDIHERDDEYMRKVYDSAMYVEDYLSWHKVQCDDGDKMRPIEDIQEEIHQCVKKK